jgi:hypothetical protein
LLPVLAESSTWQDAAWSAGFSSRHLRRFTNSLRVILDLPPYRMHPYGFTQQVLAALADAPVAGEAERAVG